MLGYSEVQAMNWRILDDDKYNFEIRFVTIMLINPFI